MHVVCVNCASARSADSCHLSVCCTLYVHNCQYCTHLYSPTQNMYLRQYAQPKKTVTKDNRQTHTVVSEPPAPTPTNRSIQFTVYNVILSSYRASRKVIWTLTWSCQGEAHLTVCLLNNQALAGGKAHRRSQRSHLHRPTPKSKHLYHTSGLFVAVFLLPAATG